MRPAQLPVGLQLTQAARGISRAFDQALAEAGGSLPVWLVLLAMKTSAAASQRELAEAVGVKEATLTHHLNAMEEPAWSPAAAIRRTAGSTSSS